MTTMKVKLISLLIVCSYFISGCSSTPEVSNLSEYKQWFFDPSNGFYKQKFIGGLEYSLLYKHYELMALQEIISEGVNDEERRTDIINEYRNGVAFVLKIGYDSRGKKEIPGLVNTSVKNYAEYEELIRELAFGIQEKISLQINGNEYDPSVSHFERGYELEKEASFLIAFNLEESPQDYPMSFVFNDDVFNSGVNKFYFDITKVKTPQIPKM